MDDITRGYSHWNHRMRIRYCLIWKIGWFILLKPWENRIDGTYAGNHDLGMFFLHLSSSFIIFHHLSSSFDLEIQAFSNLMFIHFPIVPSSNVLGIHRRTLASHSSFRRPWFSKMLMDASKQVWKNNKTAKHQCSKRLLLHDYIGDYTTQIVGDWNNPIIGNSQIAYLVGGWVCLNPSEKYFSSSIGMMFAT